MRWADRRRWRQAVEVDSADPDPGVVITERLRLVPITSALAADLWQVHGDAEVARWYGTGMPTFEQVQESADLMETSWRLHDVHKWLAYNEDGEVVGRGGLSRTPIDDDWGQLYAFLPDEPWVREPHRESAAPFLAHAHWLEIGWALRREFWGQGYAAEIGRAGLDFAFGVLAARAVVSCTVAHNTRSQMVMRRIGMREVGTIHSQGIVEGSDQERPDAPFVVSVMLRGDWDMLLAGG